MNQQFQVMAQVVSMAFGGGTKESVSEADIPKTGAQALTMFAALKL